MRRAQKEPAAANRAVDIVIGNLGEKRALYALTDSGVTVFDGEKWLPVANAPSTGRTLADEIRPHLLLKGVA